MNRDNIILSVLTGSKAYGLDNEDSDIDKVGVYVEPTENLLRVNNLNPYAYREEGYLDTTYWELGHFLKLAIQCNPSVLEVFNAPVLQANVHGAALRTLLPYVLDSDKILASYLGYASNQRAHFQAHEDKRARKFAYTYLRILYWGWELLTTGAYTTRIVDTDIGPTLLEWRAGFFKHSEVLALCEEWEGRLEHAYDISPKHIPQLDKVDDYLLHMRQMYWFHRGG